MSPEEVICRISDIPQSANAKLQSPVDTDITHSGSLTQVN